MEGAQSILMSLILQFLILIFKIHTLRYWLFEQIRSSGHKVPGIEVAHFATHGCK